jgi:tetratricopeptide (TPR) repeat protein
MRGRNFSRGLGLILAISASLSSQSSTPNYQAAIQLVQQGQFERGIPIILQILEASPSDLKARNLLGIALSGAGRKEEANVQFRKILEAQPGFMPVIKNLAVNELALGQLAEARGHFEQVLKASPQDPVAHFGMGELSFADQNFDKALAHYDASSDLYLKDPQATIRYARACVHENKTDAAATALGKMAPDADARAHFDAGVLLAGIEKYPEAAREFQAAQSGYPDPYQAGYNLTLAYEKSGDHARALQAGEATLAKGYRKAELYNLMAQAYEHTGRTQEAYQALRSATQVDPRDETNYVDLMALCLSHQNYELSLEISEIALRVLPKSYRIPLERGVVRAMQGNFEDAEQEFASASHLGGEANLPYVALALVRMQMNKLPEAVEVLRERRKANPEDYLPNWFLGEALNREGVLPGSPEEAEAVAALEQSIRLKSDRGAPRTLLGKFLSKRGDLAHAAQNFEAALKLDPEDTTAAYQLALVYRKQGDTKRAEELFEKVRKSKSEDNEQVTQRNLVQILREGAH